MPGLKGFCIFHLKILPQDYVATHVNQKDYKIDLMVFYMHHQICHITKLKLLATKWTMHT